MSATCTSYATNLRVAYDIDLQSTQGERSPFGKLVLGKGDHITSIFVFICHIFCICDQCFARAVSYHLTSSVLEKNPEFHGPCQLTIVGCGEPIHETPYVPEPPSPFPVFTKSTGKAYVKTRVTKTTTRIMQPPSYLPVSLFSAMAMEIKRTWRMCEKKVRIGRPEQNCGERMFRNGTRLYIRRVGHAEQLTAEKLWNILDWEMGSKAFIGET